MTAFDLTLVMVSVFGAGAIVMAYLSRLLLAAGARAGGKGVDGGAATARRLVFGLWTWTAISVAVGSIVELEFTLFLPVLIVILASGTALTFQKDVAAVLREMVLHKLIAMQFYRNLGAVFLYLYYASDYLSRGFAMNAGWGDVLTGMLAIPVAYMVYKRMPGAALAVVIWCAIGVGDLILAPASARIYGGEGLEAYPLNLIPLFLGPPFGILMHIVTLRVLWLQRRTEG